MRRIILPVCLAVLGLAAQVQPASAQEPWESLFNGKDLEGWKIVGSKGKAWVEEGAIVCHQVSNTPEHTFVCSRKKYGDFILEAEAMIEGELHTGFLFRCEKARADTSRVSLYGYQVKIDPTPRRWTGGIFDDYGLTWEWYYPLKESEGARSAFRLNEWNHFRIEALGDTLRVWVNGIPTTNLVHGKYEKGYIAMKIHSMGEDPEKEKVLMRYRDIRVISRKPENYKKAMEYPLIDLH